MQPSFGLVTILTPQSHRMAEAGGDLWGPPVPVPAQAGPRAVSPAPLERTLLELSPLPAALRILNSPSMARAALDLHFGLSRAPLLSPGGGIYHQSTGAGPETCKFQPEAAPVCGGSDPSYFPTKTSPFPVLSSLLSSQLAPQPSPRIPAALPHQGQLPFLIHLPLLEPPKPSTRKPKVLRTVHWQGDKPKSR